MARKHSQGRNDQADMDDKNRPNTNGGRGMSDSSERNRNSGGTDANR